MIDIICEIIWCICVIFIGIFIFKPFLKFLSKNDKKTDEIYDLEKEVLLLKRDYYMKKNESEER